MKRLMPILLLLLYFVALIRPVAPLLEYWLNKDFIVSNLCERKDELENTCQGMCHLKKQVKNVADAGKTSETPAKIPSIDFESYPVSLSAVAGPRCTELLTGRFDYYDCLHPICDTPKEALFHPPEAETA